jgi:hypothetical protein
VKLQVMQSHYFWQVMNRIIKGQGYDPLFRVRTQKTMDTTLDYKNIDPPALVKLRTNSSTSSVNKFVITPTSNFFFLGSCHETTRLVYKVKTRTCPIYRKQELCPTEITTE